MLFLMPNEQCQSIEDSNCRKENSEMITGFLYPSTKNSKIKISLITSGLVFATFIVSHNNKADYYLDKYTEQSVFDLISCTKYS